MKVTLLKDGHKHAGRDCKKGDVIDVPPAVAVWLAASKRELIAPPTKADLAAAEKADLAATERKD